MNVSHNRMDGGIESIEGPRPSLDLRSIQDTRSLDPGHPIFRSLA